MRTSTTAFLLSSLLSLVTACASASAAPHALTDGGTEEDTGAPDAGPLDQDAGPLQPVQMNDVSILLPLPKTQSEFDAMISPAGTGSSGALLDHTMYVNATGFRDDAGPAVGGVTLPYSSLRLVALRLDPCFAQIGPITDPSACQNQLRLIFQSVGFTASGSPSVDDGAVHALYSVTRAELLDALRTIQSLRTAGHGAGDLGPLAVHPVVSAEGLTGPMATGLAAIVAKYAGTSRLVRFTTFVGNGQFDWEFDGFDVSGGVAQALAIPTLPNAATAVTINNAQNGATPAELALAIVPGSTSTDDISLLLNAKAATSASHDDQQSAFDSALRVQNPNFESPNTIDCGSCHLAQPAQVLVGEQALGLSAVGDVNAFAAATTIPAADLQATTPVTTGLLNFHAFSYLVTTPMINQRVINETASIVAYLSTQ